MDQNYNTKNTVETNKNTGETNNNVVPDYHCATSPGQIFLTPRSPNDHSTFSRTPLLTSSHSKSSTSVTPGKKHTSKNIVTMTSSPLKKNQFIQGRKLNLTMKNKKTPILIIFLVRNTLNIANTSNNHVIKNKEDAENERVKKDTNQIFKDFAFTKRRWFILH